jgi:hypothetical protein
MPINFQILAMTLRGLFDPSERDRLERNLLGSELLDTLPVVPGESMASRAERAHWEVVVRIGLPRAEHVSRWVEKGRTGLVPPRDQIQRWIDARTEEGRREHRSLESNEPLINACYLIALVDELNGTPLTDAQRENLEILKRHS